MSKYVYTYRLTCFNGSAPCYDNDLLSLAICKRDMRRVIGNRITNDNDEVWIIGLVGKALAQTEPFRGYENQVLYVANITDVKEFHDYFGKGIYNRRRDNIYIRCNDETKEPRLESGGHLFIHNSKSSFHIDDSNLQKRDFDVDKKNSRKYVLLSNEYSFIKKEESQQILNCIMDNDNKLKPSTKRLVPSGVGHSWFTDDSETVISILKKISQDHIADRNVNALPKDFSQKNCTSCCGNKREDTI